MHDSPIPWRAAEGNRWNRWLGIAMIGVALLAIDGLTAQVRLSRVGIWSGLIGVALGSALADMMKSDQVQHPIIEYIESAVATIGNGLLEDESAGWNPQPAELRDEHDENESNSHARRNAEQLHMLKDGDDS